METYEGGPEDNSLESLYNKYADRSPDAGGEGYRQPFLDRVIEGTKKGFGTDRLGLSPENQIKYDPTGIVQTFAAPADLILRAPTAITGFLSSLLAGGYGKIPGVDETQTNSANRDLYNLGNAAMLELGNPRARAPTDLSSIPRYGEVLPPLPPAPLTAIKRAEPPIIDIYGETQPRPPASSVMDLPASQSRPLSIEYTAPIVEPVAAPVRRAKDVPVAPPIPTYDRQLSPLGFYSYGAETAANLAQAKGTPQQFRSMLEKGGVKPVEMEGFNEAFANRPSVTRDELTQYFNERRPQVEETVLRNNKLTEPEMEERGWLHWMQRTPEQEARYQELSNNTGAKFQQYTLPGGENYREVLLKLPDPSNTQPQLDAISKRMDEILDRPGNQLTPELRNEWDNLNIKRKSLMYDTSGNVRKEVNPFQSTHWDDPNVLAHLRMTDRTGSNGEKILHLEEIQSDWGQKGKKEGFDKPKVDLKPFAADRELARMASVRLAQNMIERESGGRFNSLSEVLDSGDVDLINRMRAAKKTDAELISANEAFQAADRALQEARAGNRSSIPTAPYVTTTAAWTDLALKRALKEAAEGGYDRLVWTPGAEQAKRYDLSKQVKTIEYFPNADDGTYYVNVVSTRGDYVHLSNAERMTLDDIERTVGKEIAEKIKTGEGSTRSFHRGRVLEGLDLQVGGEGMKGYYDKILPTQLSKLVKKLDPEARIESHNLDTRSAADKRAMAPEGQSINTISAPSLTITPKMREAIMKGQTDFARGGSIKGYAKGGPEDNSLEALYNKYAEESPASGGEVKEEKDFSGLPIGVTEESVRRNVAMTSARAQDLSNIKDVARSNRAYLVNLYNKGEISREELEDEFRRPLLGSTASPSMLRQAKNASAEDVTKRLQAAQRLSEYSPSPVQQGFAGFLHVRDDPNKAQEYISRAMERAVGKAMPDVVEDLIQRGRKHYEKLSSQRGYATGGPANNSLEALYNKYAAPTTRQRTRARYAEGGPVSSAAIYDPAEIDALAASIIEGNYA